MSNNPYFPAPPREYSIRQQGPLPAEVKRVWNRFLRLNGKMHRWHKSGEEEKVKSRMWKWEQYNRAAWAAGFDVPDEFDPDGPRPQMKLRSQA